MQHYYLVEVVIFLFLIKINRKYMAINYFLFNSFWGLTFLKHTFKNLAIDFLK